MGRRTAFPSLATHSATAKYTLLAVRDIVRPALPFLEKIYLWSMPSAVTDRQGISPVKSMKRQLFTSRSPAHLPLAPVHSLSITATPSLPAQATHNSKSCLTSLTLYSFDLISTCFGPHTSTLHVTRHAGESCFASGSPASAGTWPACSSTITLCRQ